jgi:hypothetical protein
LRFALSICLTVEQGIIQSDFSKETLEICLELLSDPIARSAPNLRLEPALRNRRVRAHAAACLTNYFESAELPSFAAFLDPVIRALLRTFHGGPLYVQEQVVATLCQLLGAFRCRYTEE